MSTAAPPAAAPAAAVPAATPATPAGEPNAPQAAASPQPKIKPIPPPRLPGVMEDGPEDASAPEAVAARERDARGRFAKTTSGEPIVRKPEPRAVEADGEAPPPPEAKPKFKFAGREFDSQEAAEHYVKSMEGRFKPVQETLTAREKRLAEAADSARGWHARAQELQAQLEALQAGGGNPEPEPTPAEPAPQIDWQLYAEISRIAQEAGEPWKAQQWLHEQNQAIINAEIARLRAEAIEGPRAEAEARAQLTQAADTLVESMAAHTNADGSPAFPEFQNPQTAHEIGSLWREAGLDPELALTPGGAVAAVALYRMARGLQPNQPAAPAPVAAAPAPPDLAAAAAASLDGGRPVLPAATPRRELDPGVARLVAGLKSTQLLRPGLGFEA